MVVAGREQEINARWGYSPVKLKIERPALGISLVSKRLAGSMVGTCRVRRKWLLKWWEAGTRRLSGGGCIPLPN
jgi:hypothetical protein